jgi:hypothetical protein
MIRFSRVVIVAGAAVTFAACSEMGPTAPRRAPAAAAAGDLVVGSSSTVSASCTVTPNGADYDDTVTWSGLFVSSIELWQTNGTQPLAQAVLGRATRKGSFAFAGVVAAPDYAQLTGRQGGVKTPCVTGP